MTNLWGTPVKPADVSVIPYSIDTYVTWGYSKIFKLYLLVSTYPNSTPVEIKHKGHALIWIPDVNTLHLIPNLTRLLYFSDQLSIQLNSTQLSEEW